MKKLIVIAFIMLQPVLLKAVINPFAKWNKEELLLCNSVVRRVIKLPAPVGRLITTSFHPVGSDFSYFTDSCSDFRFSINGKTYSGYDTWKLMGIRVITDELQGSGATVTLRDPLGRFEVALNYMMYNRSPAIRKSISVKNLGTMPLKFESVDIEHFEVPAYYPVTFSWIYTDFGRRKHIGPFEGGRNDALVIVHDMNREEGIVLGNEAPGVLKRTSVFFDEQAISIGLTHNDAQYPFRKWITKGEQFTTPEVFIMLYNKRKSPDYILNIVVPEYVREHMGARFFALTEKPEFVYNTWEPFTKNINEKLIMELAKSAAAAGVKEFVIDDGWQDRYGDWGIDTIKFPHGLKPVFDYIKSLGMKPGLWVSIGSAAKDSKVYSKHPSWFVKDINGKPTSIHIPGDNEKFTACMSTGWYDYIKGVLTKLAVDYGLEYFKLDFAVVTSAYTYDHRQSGCYATDHPGHKDHAESLYENYERLWLLFDELHKAKPSLFIDCTFETMGGMQLIDYSLLGHAEGDWLSNFDGNAGEKTDIRIRNMAWWRSPAIPASTMIIGNSQMQDMEWETHLKSLAGSLPILLGDPRKCSQGDLDSYSKFSGWLHSMQLKYSILEFRQDLPGMGEPAEGYWDGFQRINVRSQDGGIVGVFRHGSKEIKRIVSVNYLSPERMYEVRSEDGTAIAAMNGRDLYENGFEVTLNALYSGKLFEIAPK